MNRLKKVRRNQQRRARRVRSGVIGTSERPRLSVHISNLHISAQIIDDSRGETLSYVTTVGRKMEGTMKERAHWVGSEIAKKANKAKVKQVVFDRADKKYHGRIKTLADAARSVGLEF